MFAIPKQPVATPARPAKRLPFEESAQPDYIGVACRVCQTRLFGRLSQVGQELKCPDCGAMTVLKALTPEAEISPRPAGEQYELWDADDAPLPVNCAAQPKYIAVNADCAAH
jgi:hypothetical protein